jgi:hypothetical protein
MTNPTAALLALGVRVRCTIPGHALEGKQGTIESEALLKCGAWWVSMDEAIPIKLQTIFTANSEHNALFTADEIEAVEPSNPPK